MTSRHHGAHPRLGDLGVLHAAREMNGAADGEADVKNSRLHGRDLVCQRHLGQRHIDVGKFQPKRAKRVGHEPHQHGFDVTDREAPSKSLRGLARSRHRMGGLGEREASFNEERAAGFREPHPAAIAVEQLHADFGFQIPDLIAQRRLRDAQSLRGLAEAQLFRDGYEVTNVPQLHPAAVIRKSYQARKNKVISDAADRC